MPRTNGHNARLTLLNLSVGHVRSQMRAGRLHRIQLLSLHVASLYIFRRYFVIGSVGAGEKWVGAGSEAEENELMVGVVG